MLEISKQEFCSAIEAIENEQQFIDNLNDLNIFVDRDNKLIDIVIDFLKDKTNDELCFIDWYLFDRVITGYSVVDITSKTLDAHINVDSSHKLYELLVLLDEDDIYNDDTTIID